MRHSLVGCLALLAAVAQSRAETLVLAREGKPQATIVLPAGTRKKDGPEAKLELAAVELQAYVRKICGVELPIRRDGKRVAGTGLYIGRCEPTLESDLPERGLNPEAYAIRVRDGSVLFTGRYPTPTYFAVASFLEDCLGIRWFAPGEEWEYVPEGAPGELSLEVVERPAPRKLCRSVVSVPDTSPRVWSSHAFNPGYVRWNLRNKVVLSEVVPRRQFQNNLYRVFSPTKYAHTHPEYYPLVNGQRWIPEGEYRYWRPCESNPEVLRLTVEAARRWFDDNPGIDSFSLGMDDIAYMCGCPGCRAMDAHPDSYKKREFSDRHYKFVNAVAREIARTHPDRYIGTLIYSIARKPPETVPRLEDNVFGFITEVAARWCEPGRRQADQQLTREWAGRCKHLSRYDYFGLGTFTPRYYPHTMAEAIKYDKSLGLEGMYTELNTFLPHTAPMVWAFARLQWDSRLEIDALLSEFFTRMFGPAAATVAQYYDVLEKSWNSPPPTRTDWEHRNIFIQAQAISPQAVDEGMALLDAALKQADSDAVRSRIETIRAGLRFAGYAIKQYALSEEVLTMPLAGSADADRIIAGAAEIMRLGSEREPFWAAAMSRSDLLGQSIQGLNVKGYLMIGRVGNLERGASLGGLRVLEWYAEHQPQRLPEVAAKLTAAGGSGSELLRGWLWVQEHKPANLLENGGFEALADDAEGTLPAAWKTYQSAQRARFGLAAEGARGGSRCVNVSGAESSAVFLQHAAVEPGENYLGVAYARSAPSGVDGRGYLGVRWQTPKGTWHPRSDLEPQVFAVPREGWQPLVLLAKAPAGAGRAVVMVGAKQQPAGASMLFDDVALYRLEKGD